MAFLERQDAEVAARVFAGIPAPSLAALKDAPPTEWVSWEHDKYFPESVIREFGEERAHQLWRAYLPTHLKSGRFRNLVDSAIRLFGLKPSSLIKVLPRAWSQSFQGFCELEVTQAAHRIGRLSMTNIPPCIEDWPSYAFSHKAIFEGIFDITKVEGEIEVKSEPAFHRREYIFRWD